MQALIEFFLMFFSTAKRSLALLHSVLTGSATHETLRVHSGLGPSRLFPSHFHNMILARWVGQIQSNR